MSSKEEFDEFDDVSDVFETIILRDAEDNETEFCILETTNVEGCEYFLVIESDLIDDEDVEASIIKKVYEENDDYVIEFVEEDAEFERIASIFQNQNDEFDFEF